MKYALLFLIASLSSAMGQPFTMGELAWPDSAWPRAGSPPGTSDPVIVYGPTAPNTISNLTVWLKADAGLFSDSAGTTPAVNGNKVGRWTDQTGNGFNPSNPGGGGIEVGPYYFTNALNGLPVVRFVYPTNALYHSFNSNAPLTILALIKFLVPNTYDSEFLGFAQGGCPGGVNTPGIGLNYPDFSATIWMNHTIAGLGQVVATNQFVIIGGQVNGVGSIVRAGGVSSGTFNISSPTIDSLFLSGFSNTNSICLTNGFYKPFTGDMAEILIYSRALSSAEMGGLEAYLTSKWGL